MDNPKIIINLRRINLFKLMKLILDLLCIENFIIYLKTEGIEANLRFIYLYNINYPFLKVIAIFKKRPGIMYVTKLSLITNGNCNMSLK